MKKRTKWLLALLVSAVLSGLLIPAVYVRLVDPPSALREQALPAGIIALSDLEGSWRIADGSIVGYRVREQIGLSKTEGVGRTEAIEGIFEISGETLVAAVFTVDMATLVSDRSQRDDQVRGRILRPLRFPTRGSSSVRRFLYSGHQARAKPRRKQLVETSHCAVSLSMCKCSFVLRVPSGNYDSLVKLKWCSPSGGFRIPLFRQL